MRDESELCWLEWEMELVLYWKDMDLENDEKINCWKVELYLENI